ncbi:MAG: hypothetical protein ABI556_03660 [Gemmatimonadales bacterium]
MVSDSSYERADSASPPVRAVTQTVPEVPMNAGLKQRTHRLIVLPLASAFVACAGQKDDSSYHPRIDRPAHSAGSTSPRFCIDAGHYNSHTADGLYKPFANLLRADGYRVSATNAHFDRGIPSECDVLVVVNATGGKTYKLFGLNIPTKSRERRPEPAFTQHESDSLVAWIHRGGSLLLIADHYPFGSAARTLARSLGIDMSGGFTEARNVDHDTPRDGSRLVYSRANGLLKDHPVTTGRSQSERVTRVVTFTGQSLRSSDGIPFLLLGDSAVDYVGTPPELHATSANGRSQGLALVIGRGRVVVLAEAGMLTAQVDDKGSKFGMQLPGNDNQQLALNIAHWLSRLASTER